MYAEYELNSTPSVSFLDADGHAIDLVIYSCPKSAILLILIDI